MMSQLRLRSRLSHISVMKSFLDLVNECDSFPYPDSDEYEALFFEYYLFLHEGYTIGYLVPSVVTALKSLGPENSRFWSIDDAMRVVTLTEVTTTEERSAAVHSTTTEWHEKDVFKVLKGWRNELYAVYAPPGKLAFNVDRSASPLFGVITYGVHMTAYVRTPSGLSIWVPRRARDKQTYGGFLDNTVGGGLTSGELPLDSLVRESQEEASLSAELIKEGAKSVGVVTYFYVRNAKAGGETGLLQPECEYVYDLELTEEVVPKPGDSEVEDFTLMTVEDVQRAMKNDEFKPNCNVVLLDFFIRHGIITPENEKSYLEINSRIHRRFDFPTI